MTSSHLGGGAEHRLTLRGSSGESYSAAIKSLQDAVAEEDAATEGTATKGKLLHLEWTAPDEEVPDGDGAPATDDVSVADGSSDAVAIDEADTTAVSEDESVANTTDSDADSLAGLSEQTISATLYADESKEALSAEQGVSISIQGMLPKDAVASAYPVQAEIDGQTVLAAYDITVYNADGSVFQPAEGQPVKVTISSSALQIGTETIGVYHAGGTEETESDVAVDGATAIDGSATLDVDSTEASVEPLAETDSEPAESASENTTSLSYEYVGAAERTDVATVSFYATHFSPYVLAAPLRAPFGQNLEPLITTVDTRSVGVKLNLFDYEAYDLTYSDPDHGTDGPNLNFTRQGWGGQWVPNLDYRTGINITSSNELRDLRFYPSGIGHSNGQYTINNYTGSHSSNNHDDQIALQGVVQSTLNNGYPVTTTGSSLEYLFDTNNIQDAKTVYEDVNHLFTLDSSGYYRYDSGSGRTSNHNYTGNYAYYNTDPKNNPNRNFIVYDTTYTNNNSGGDAASDKIGFFPFNDQDTSQQNVQPNRQSGANHYNHHLGLTMTATFMMPEGKMVNGNDMIFNFSGDDDMWVFIDGVLVLDIGGIHQPVSGSINFTQGTSTVNEGALHVGDSSGTTPVYGQTKNIAQIFSDARRIWDDSEYSTHTIQCFYLERGGCYSDLSLSFNLPIYNPGQIHVTKTVDGPGSANYMETGFKFKVFIETSQGSGQYYQYLGPVTMDNGTPISGADADGTYTLKSGEGFKVPTQNDKLRYYVQEIDPGSAFSTTINGQATGVVDGVVQSPTKPVSDSELNYKNSVTGVTVSVQKKWYGQDGITEQTEGLPESVSLTLHRTWTTEEGGGTTPTPTKHRVTFRVTSYAQTNAFISSVDDVADEGSLTFYPYGGVTSTGQGDPWSLPQVSKQSGSASLGDSNPPTQYINWKNVPGYTLSNITSDVTILLTYNQWITVDPTRTDRAVPNVTSYTQAQSGGGTPTPGTVVHHDVIVNGPDDPSPVPGLVNPITVTAETDWRGEWNGLPIADAQGNPYTYYVDESLVPAGYVVVYENNGTTNGSGSHTGIPSGEITVKNKLAYQLPHTGGAGTSPFTIVGLSIAGTAVVLLALQHKWARGGHE